MWNCGYGRGYEHVRLHRRGYGYERGYMNVGLVVEVDVDMNACMTADMNVDVCIDAGMNVDMCIEADVAWI